MSINHKRVESYGVVVIRKISLDSLRGYDDREGGHQVLALDLVPNLAA